MMRRNQKKFATVLAVAALLWGGTLAGSYTVNAAEDIVKNGGQASYDIDKQNKDTNIAIGPGSKFFIGGGTQESILSFGEEAVQTFKSFLGLKIPSGWHIHDNAAAKENLPAAIAIGQNTYARTGSIQVGSHTLEKNDVAIGDTTAKNLRQFGVASTTLGTNSYTSGGFSTNIGSYNVHSSPYEAKDSGDTLSNGPKNSFATIVGAFNSNESMGTGSTSGIANTISGAANKVTQSNGAIVIGAGNTVSGSRAAITTPGSLERFSSVKEMQDKLIEGVRQNAGGAALVMGGGNQLDGTTYSQLLGVNNNSKKDKYVLLDGFQNTSSNSKNLSLMGSQNTADTVKNTQLFGDKRKLTKVENSVIIGSAANETELTVSNATILGYNANVKTQGGVALGFESILNDSESGIGTAGWNGTSNNNYSNDDYVWKPTHAAVSVGVSGTSTRRITNVAAGLNDTDAVNVAQLKKAMENTGGGGGTGGSVNLIAGDGIKLSKDATGNWTISTHINTTGSDEVSYKEKTDSLKDGETAGNAVHVETKLTADDGKTTSLGDNGKLGIKGDGSNISTSVDGSNVKVALNKDIKVDSVTINNGGPTINNNGINMNEKKITNLADGDISEGSHDAVTGGQLWNVEQSMNGRVSRLDTKIDRVGAGAAAMANLHPLDFDPEDKWSFSAGFGNYRSASAMAVGAFYRPNERTLFSLSSSFGNGENMLGLGASFKIGKESPKTRANLQKTIASLEETVRNQEEALKAQDEKIARLEALVEKLMER